MRARLPHRLSQEKNLSTPEHGVFCCVRQKMPIVNRTEGDPTLAGFGNLLPAHRYFPILSSFFPHLKSCIVLLLVINSFGALFLSLPLTLSSVPRKIPHDLRKRLSD
ncbi:hypothetical protein PGTUg99_050290 [Puccinia graminis f. sp. tritici]|uniref:Uncharacterized protein n=1 Tax=Puccinia graminis f. sp. tritici TaxID=56615 RepID=A0A5B0N273_PUCGR|nr:hypothetical protein PGTUg99_050290 [Puccinia graminis f. sp. tritici]